MFDCNHCDQKATRQPCFTTHIKSIQAGFGYDCNQCGCQSSPKSHLTIHKGVMFDCNHCDQKATRQPCLTTHMKSIQAGFGYDCNQCGCQSSPKSHLTIHEGEMFDCNLCD